VRARRASQQSFALNEMETVIRSLPLRAGYQVILPLFSEIDESVEYDTVTVVGGPTAKTREVLAETVTQRRSGKRMRFVPVAQAPG
jgi:hypothetical protein